MKNIKSFKENFQGQTMSVEVEIPQSIIDVCREYGVKEENIKEVFSNYIDDVVGTTWGQEDNQFRIFCDEADNIVDYIDETEEDDSEV